MKEPRNEREEHSALMRTPAMPVEPERGAINANELPLTAALWALIVVAVFAMFVF